METKEIKFIDKVTDELRVTFKNCVSELMDNGYEENRAKEYTSNCMKFCIDLLKNKPKQ